MSDLADNVILNSFPSEQVTAAAASYLNQLLEKYQETAVLFLSSGGSSIKILESVNTDLIDADFTFGMLDDRFSHDSSINNLLQLSRMDFYDRLIRRGVKILDTVPDENETIEELAQKWQDSLKSWHQSHSGGVVIITQGVGPDGHTSGILPFPEDPTKFQQLFESDNWTAGYDGGNKNPYPQRITVTTSFLKQIVTHSVVYLTGQEKQTAFQKMLDQQGSLADVPARVIWQMKDVQIFTDLK